MTNTKNKPISLSRDARRAMGAYVPRQRDSNEVRAPENSVWERPKYIIGDGDNAKQTYRTGSNDALRVASRGLAT
jgi:hypothetical protein